MRTKLFKIKTAVIFALALNAAFAQGLSKVCVSELQEIPGKKANFSLQEFLKDLPAAALKVKGQEKAGKIPVLGLFMGPGSDDKVTDIGLTVGCLKTFPESSSDIQASIKTVSVEMAKIMGTSAANSESGVKKSGSSGDVSARQPSGGELAPSKCGDSEYNPLINGCCNSTKYSLLMQFCAADDMIYDKCDGQIFDPLEEGCYLKTVLPKCGSSLYNPSKSGCCNGAVYSSMEIHYCSNNQLSEYGKLADSRDGKTYKTVVIGNQTWMGENLNYETKGSLCYGNQAANCNTYGRLYDWAAAMAACPAGWHLPSEEEWNALINLVDGTNANSGRSPTAGKYLKARNGWKENGNGTDSYGFAALPGGDGSSTGDFNLISNYGRWWGSSENDASTAYGRNIYYISSHAYWKYYDKSSLSSVRCLKD